MNNELFLGKTFLNFLDKEEINILLNFAKISNNYINLPNDSYWTNRIIYFSSLDENIKLCVLKITKRLQKLLIKEYNLNSEIYPDEMVLNRLFDGMDNPAHCDSMESEDQYKGVYNHRYFGCVIYLNNNFEGGDLFYTKHDIIIKPEPGKLVVHLGDCNHKHGVTKLKGNTRYTLSSFWTFEKNKGLTDLVNRM